MSAYNVVSRAAMASGQPEDISIVLANLDAIAAVINGNLDDSNIKVGAAIAASKIAGVGGASVDLAKNIGAANTDLGGPGTSLLAFWAASTASGTLRSIGAPTSTGSKITLKNGHASNFITLKHQLAGGAGAQLSIINNGDKYLAPGQSIDLIYDGTYWQEINRPAVETIFDYSVAGAVVANLDTNNILPGAIPQVYSHLRGYLRARVDYGVGSNIDGLLRFNNDAVAANYYRQRMGANDSAAVNGAEGLGTDAGILINGLFPGNGAGNSFADLKFELPSYRDGNYKQAVMENFSLWGTPAGNMYVQITGGQWRNVAALSRLQIVPANGNIVVSSRFVLEGIT